MLDVSATAVDRVKSRLGDRAGRVEWIEADVTADPALGHFDAWHDRAVFHFLTEARDRERYVRLARRTLPVGSHLTVATFALDGPQRCGGLEVCRYDVQSLVSQLGNGFELVKAVDASHVTPWGKLHAFLYAVFRRSLGRGSLSP